MEVSTTAYEFAHGKKPRGSGQWAFFFDGRTGADDAVWFYGSFADAKRMAVKWAVFKDYRRVEVGS